MKKLAILLVLALELASSGCGGRTPASTTTTTDTSGNWEALLTNGTGQDSLLNFTISFSVNNSGPLNVTGFSFFNQGTCFATGTNAESESGTATLTTTSTGTVSGPFNLTITSATTGTKLDLTGTITGTSNGTTTTTGTLSNGVVVGNWTLTPGTNVDPSCAAVQSGANAAFTMCQNPTNGSCPAPTT